MSTRNKFALFVSLGVLAVAAEASNWYVLTQMSDGGKDAVDLSSIVVKGGYVSAWFMNSSPVGQKINGYYPTVQTDKLYKSIKQQEIINCASREAAQAHVAYYSEENGEGIYLGSITAQPLRYVFVSVIPDTLGESRLEYACKYISGRKVKPAT